MHGLCSEHEHRGMSPLFAPVLTPTRTNSSKLSTRLMILKGAFECVSMAIYGDVVNELPPPQTTYEPKLLPTLDPIPVSNALDPANARDPTKLARQLLELIPNAPPLPLIIRLMFCLKPSNEDWDLPEFPYIYAELEQLPDDATVEDMFKATKRPISDDLPAQYFPELAEKIARMLDTPVSVASHRRVICCRLRTDQSDTQSYYVAGFLAHAACQHPEMAKSSLVSCKNNMRMSK